MRIEDGELWELTSGHALRLLHKYRSRDYVLFLDVFDKRLLHRSEEDREDHAADSLEERNAGRRADPEFFERIVGVLPIQIRGFRPSELTRVFEVLSRRQLGDERLYMNFIYTWLEKQMRAFTLP